MPTSSFSQTYYGGTSVSVPGNAKDIYLNVYGAKGGVNLVAGGSPGLGKAGRFKLKQDFQSRTLNIRVGQPGGNGGVPDGGVGGGGFSGAARGGAGGAGFYTFTYDCTYAAGICTCPVCCGKPCTNSPPCAGGYLPGNGCAEGGLRWFCPRTCTGSGSVGGGGGGGGGVGFYVNGTIAVIAGGGGGAGGYNGYGNGAYASGWSGSGAFSISSGANGTGRGSNGGTGGGGGGAGSSVGWTTAARSRYNTSLVDYVQDLGYWNTTTQVQVSWTTVTPQINSLFYTGGDSSDGNPDTSIQINFSISDWTNATLSGPFGTVNYTLGNSLTYTWNNIPTSVAGSNSPYTATVTLTAYAGTASTSQSITVSITNDNNPSSVPYSLIGLGSLTQLEPISTRVLLCSINGVDMPTKVVSQSTGTRIGLNQTNFGSSRTVPVGNNFYVEFTVPDFNTSTVSGGTNAQGEVIGQTNPFNVVFLVGTDTITVPCAVRAPVIQEAFDFNGISGTYPYPDIDVVPLEPNTDQFLVTEEEVMDDIEIDVEIKASDPNQQVRINGGPWQDMRGL